MSYIMRKPVYAICEQQRRRSACASAQSDLGLCCSLSGYYSTSTCYSWNFKTLASIWSWAGQFESYLVGNPKNRFSRDEAQMVFCQHILWCHCQVIYNREVCFGKQKLSMEENKNISYKLMIYNSIFKNSLVWKKLLIVTVMILSFRTDRPGQTVQTQIRLLLEEQSDQGLHCLPFCLHRLDSLVYGKAT